MHDLDLPNLEHSAGPSAQFYRMPSKMAADAGPLLLFVQKAQESDYRNQESDYRKHLGTRNNRPEVSTATLHCSQWLLLIHLYTRGN